MRIRYTIWKEQFVEKLEDKHGVSVDEVEQCLCSNPFVRKVSKGRRRGEDVYAAYGRTEVGRCLIVIFVAKKPGGAMPISGRDMTDAERRYYEKQTKQR